MTAMETGDGDGQDCGGVDVNEDFGRVLAAYSVSIREELCNEPHTKPSALSDKRY